MKPASVKRAPHPRAASYGNSFIKDWEKLARSGRYDMHALKQAILLMIANDGPLGPEWLDHPLKGDWAGHRECHVGGDFLLIYQIDSSARAEQVIFVRTGTHTELFRE